MTIGRALLMWLLCVRWAAADDLSQAREHYRRGTAFYDLRRYHEAAKEYEAAFELKDEATLLFNIGQAYRFAAEYEDAIGAYRSFLRRLPRAPNRADVEQRITEMQSLLEQRRADESHPPHGTLAPPSPAPVAEPPPSHAPSQPASQPSSQPSSQPASQSGATSESKPVDRWRAWRLGGLGAAVGGAALVIVGAALVGVAAAAGNQFTHPTQGSMFDPSLERRALGEQNAGIALLAIGGAAAATGAAVSIVGWRKRK